jgi:orotidine-5'-phosphate decarboxylase
LHGNLYEKVIKKCMEWGSSYNMMFVAGATHPSHLEGIRAIAPDYFLLVPGIGAQGGSLNEVAAAAMTKDCALIVNASRSILFASSGKDFAQAAREEAMKLQQQMSFILQNR